MEITNCHVDVYLKGAGNTRVKSVTLKQFFGYTQDFYDPRVVYDHDANRWILSAAADRESPYVQYFFFAISQSSDPTGPFYIFRVNVSSGPSTIWDFPQLGLDRNAVIFTADVYDGNTYVGASLFTVAKSLLYSGPGQTLTPHLFTGLTGTLSPPVVLDTNPNTYLVAAPTPLASSNQVTLYTLTNSAANPPTLSGPAFISVPAYGVPPSAPNPARSHPGYP